MRSPVSTEAAHESDERDGLHSARFERALDGRGCGRRRDRRRGEAPRRRRSYRAQRIAGALLARTVGPGRNAEGPPRVRTGLAEALFVTFLCEFSLRRKTY